MRMTLRYTPDAVATLNDPDDEVRRRSMGRRLAPSTMTTAPRTGVPVTLSRTVPKMSWPSVGLGKKAALSATVKETTTERFTGHAPGAGWDWGYPGTKQGSPHSRRSQVLLTRRRGAAEREKTLQLSGCFDSAHFAAPREQIGRAHV